jgi:hypothetical protein
MKKVKVVIKEMPQGLKFTVYKEVWGIWWYFYGYPASDVYIKRFDEDIDRMKKIYGEMLLIEDCRPQTRTCQNESGSLPAHECKHDFIIIATNFNNPSEKYLTSCLLKCSKCDKRIAGRRQ